MKSNKITQEEFDALEVNEQGYKECPGFTDYANIKSFGEGCRFGERCSFGEYCSFGECCGFGEGCRFGERCSFGEECSFGGGCSFGEYCRFGKLCRFGERCRFGGGCRFECINSNHELSGYKCKGRYPFVSMIGFGSRVGSKTYYFNFEEGVYVRCGCFFGSVEEFKERCLKESKLLYISAADLAIKQIEEWNSKV